MKKTGSGGQGPALEHRIYGALRRMRLAGPLTLIRKGLTDSGWRRSNRLGRSVDSGGHPLPWYTYPAIHLMAARVRPDHKVFEFGTGNSTLWYAQRVKSVVAVEHDSAFAKEIAGQAPPNVSIVLRTGEDEYAGEVRRHGLFDIVVIDGLQWRVACAEQAVDRLSGRGVVVWDNSDRADFQAAVDAGLFAGFRELPLHGFGPLGGAPWVTSILYRDGNCLGL